ncbi:CDP-glycerol--undecaprenyl-pyrophosphoryl-N-acetylglucosaminyl-N- acetylmannosamine glycerophosphotransferase [Brochothrix thermosphacta DSM 20171 = FSL F6-1036]|nr:CDP-glycerol--undecaprenyl-pyrophosphoryl-N-acetylglucosaminyl-N- acetylmannosamine glycerophosphotransferase [Brochothrix thermosphacta DSM 20171 = FSL F6-1036]
MLFFCYDEKEYELQQGLQQNWRTMLPGPIIATSQLLSEELKNVPYKADYEGYNKTWNTYTTGNAVKQLADYLQ